MKKYIITILITMIAIFSLSACSSNESKDYNSMSYVELVAAAQDNDVEAMIKLAQMYNTGSGDAEKDYEKSYKWYSKAAQARNSSELSENLVQTKTMLATVKVYSADCLGREWTGTGFFISENQLITNSHVVQKNYEYSYTLELWDGSKKSATLVSCDADIDLALLEVQGYSSEYCLELADGDAVAGTSITTVGYPQDYGMYTGKGTISNYPSTDRFNFDGQVDHGSSGGAIIDSQGKVVGVTVAQYNKSDDEVIDVKIGIPVSKLKTFLNAEHKLPEYFDSIEAVKAFEPYIAHLGYIFGLTAYSTDGDGNYRISLDTLKVDASSLVVIYNTGYDNADINSGCDMFVEYLSNYASDVVITSDGLKNHSDYGYNIYLKGFDKNVVIYNKGNGICYLIFNRNKY